VHLNRNGYTNNSNDSTFDGRVWDYVDAAKYRDFIILTMSPRSRLNLRPYKVRWEWPGNSSVALGQSTFVRTGRTHD